MAELATRRAGFNLYSSKNDPYSHQVRIVAAEKDTALDIIYLDPDHLPEDFSLINPYQTLPTLTDRDLVLDRPEVIMEYLDERYPHPPLLPIYPILRAKTRMLLYRIREDWYSLYEIIMANPNNAAANKARSQLRDVLINMAPTFKDTPYFLSDDFTLVDCCLLPLLWRLGVLEVKLPASSAKPLLEYATRLFQRPSFQSSLTASEKAL